MSVLRLWADAHLSPDAEPQFDWALLDGRGALSSSGRAALAECPAAARIELILPFERVLLTRVALPRQNRRQLARVAAFALEDRLLTSPENSHCVLGEPQAGEYPVVVVDKPWLERLLSLCQQAGRMPQGAWTAWDLLPQAAPGLWLRQEGWQRSASGEGTYVAEAPVADDWLTPATWDWRTAPLERQALNLLHGDLASVKSQRRGPSPWRLTALLAALVLLVQFGQLAWQVMALKKEEKRLKAGISQAFYQVFPPSMAMIDPVLQVQQKVGQLAQGPAALPASDFLSLLNRTASGITAHGIPARLRYDEETLSVQLKTPASAVAATVATLQKQALTVSELPPEKADQGPQLKIRAGGQP